MKLTGIRNSTRNLWISIICLSLAFIISIALLGNRLGLFAPGEKPFIALTPTNCKIQPVNAVQTDGEADVDSTDADSRTPSAPVLSRVINAAGLGTTYRQAPNPGFEATDENKVIWQSETPVEIFKISYDETGDVTVDGVTDKLIAPGTANDYDFTFKNTGNIALDYTMETEAILETDGLELPVEVRLKNANGNYLTGSDSEFAKVESLNGITDSATLEAGKNANYTLEWKWPFEGDDIETDDKHDTLLGNTAVDKDLKLTIIIRTSAEADYSAFNDAPDTGDNGIMGYVIVAVVAFVLLMLCVVVLLKKNKESDTEDANHTSQKS